MKKILFFVMAFVIIAAGCAVLGGGRDADLPVFSKPGEIYEGTAMGYRGPITVQVLMNGGSIMEIDVIDSEEDRFVGGAAMEELIDIVIEYNSTDVDAVSGATITSKGFLEAVNRARLLANK